MLHHTIVHRPVIKKNLGNTFRKMDLFPSSEERKVPIVFRSLERAKLNHWTTTNKVKVKVMLRPTISRPVCLAIKHPSRAYDQISVTVRGLRVCWFGTPWQTRWRVRRLQLLLALANTVILGSESHGARNHILLAQIRNFPFRRHLRLVELRWKYSTPPPHGGQPKPL
jgi:hypothetical protein